MTQETFEKFKSFIEPNLGIKLPQTKKILLESRLAKRLRALKLESFEIYADYVFSTQGFDQEIQQLIDVITTNETSFFREIQHFNYLLEQGLPTLIEHYKHRHLNAWSVAASTGQEAYTLAMILEKFSRSNKPFTYSILGTDISETVLRVAKTGVYTENQAEKIPDEYKRVFCLKSKDKNQKTIRIKPELRSLVSFKKLNLINSPYPIKKKYHIIFCRNVFIYFEKQTQEKILKELCSHLTSNGYLFMGHSENITGLKSCLKSVATAVYQKKE